MVSDLVLSERHLTGQDPTPRPIGMGSYNMDSHNTQRYVDEQGHARNEGDVQVNPGGPYSIGYGSLIPKKNQCENLLVPVCVSCTHIAFGSIRMEPVFMVLGQSAATAACLAIDERQAVQDVDYAKLERRLLDDKQVLHYAGKRSIVVRLGSLKGVVVDDSQLSYKNDWVQSRSTSPHVEYGYRHDGNAQKGKLSAVYSARLAKSGRYEVRMSYSAHSNRATNVPVTIKHGGGEAKVVVNQRKRPELGGLFHSLGTYTFKGDQPASIVVGNESTNGYVIIDAVQWLARP